MAPLRTKCRADLLGRPGEGGGQPQRPRALTLAPLHEAGRAMLRKLFAVATFGAFLLVATSLHTFGAFELFPPAPGSRGPLVDPLLRDPRGLRCRSDAGRSLSPERWTLGSAELQGRPVRTLPGRRCAGDRPIALLRCPWLSRGKLPASIRRRRDRRLLHGDGRDRRFALFCFLSGNDVEDIRQYERWLQEGRYYFEDLSRKSHWNRDGRAAAAEYIAETLGWGSSLASAPQPIGRRPRRTRRTAPGRAVGRPRWSRTARAATIPDPSAVPVEATDGKVR